MLAMIGVLVVGCVVYKKTMQVTPNKSNSILKIEDMMRLPDRKTLYVINCKNEQFLIASSNDNVSFISKLQSDKRMRAEEGIEKYIKENEISYENFESDEGRTKKSHLKNLLKELSDKNQEKRGRY